MVEQDLEEKVQAPIVVFKESIKTGAIGLGKIRLEGNNYEEIASLDLKNVEATYDANGDPEWQNPDYSDYRIANVPEHLMGTQVVFTDQVVYEGARMHGLHFSFLKDGKYIGHDHAKNAALDFVYGAIKAVFDGQGKIIWQNRDYKQD